MFSSVCPRITEVWVQKLEHAVDRLQICAEIGQVFFWYTSTGDFSQQKLPKRYLSSNK